MAEWCPVCALLWAVTQGAGRLSRANLLVEEEKTQRKLFSQSHAIRLQTNACTGSQSEATALPQ